KYPVRHGTGCVRTGYSAPRTPSEARPVASGRYCAPARSHPREQAGDEMAHDQVDQRRQTPVHGHRHFGVMDLEQVLERSDEPGASVVDRADDPVAAVGSDYEQYDRHHDYEGDDASQGSDDSSES